MSWTTTTTTTTDSALGSRGKGVLQDTRLKSGAVTKPMKRFRIRDFERAEEDDDIEEDDHPGDMRLQRDPPDMVWQLDM